MAMTIDFSKEFANLKANSPFSNENVDYDGSKRHNEELDDEQKIFAHEKKKKKKKGKKKKRKFVDDKIELLLGDDDDDESILNDDDILVYKKPKKGKKDLFDVKQAKKKKKKNIEAKFLPQIVELKKILKDANMASDQIKEIIQTIRDSKSRYVGKTMTDLFQALNTSNSNRASIVKEISNIHKTVADLQLKQEKNVKDVKKNDDIPDDDYGAVVLSRLFGGSRKEMRKMAKEYYNSQEDDYGFDNGYDDNDNLNDFIDNRLENEGTHAGRTEDGSKYIEYENMGPEDVILYHSDGSWETGAIDKHGNRMPDDYPILPKEDLGKVRFDIDDNRAQDETGRSFKVIEVP